MEVEQLLMLCVLIGVVFHLYFYKLTEILTILSYYAAKISICSCLAVNVTKVN